MTPTTAHAAPSRPVLVFRYCRGQITPYLLVAPRRHYRFEPLPRHHESVQEAARHMADRFPGCILTADPQEILR